MSETTAQGVSMRPGRFSITTSGFPIDGMEMNIMNPTEKGEGEICMKGRHIMMGYLKNEKATRETIDP
jgi:long-chain-fatty-acid--CoA ligase ACSBG